jgi:hypothetical protein
MNLQPVSWLAGLLAVVVATGSVNAQVIWDFNYSPARVPSTAREALYVRNAITGESIPNELRRVPVFESRLDRTEVPTQLYNGFGCMTAALRVGGLMFRSPSIRQASIAEVADFYDYDHFNWVQYVTLPADHPRVLAGGPRTFNDPLPGYLGRGPNAPLPDNLPYYFDETGPISDYHLARNLFDVAPAIDSRGRRLYFTDCPSDPYYDPRNNTARVPTEFATSLVGVKPAGGFDVLFTFKWASTKFAGGFLGGLATHANPRPIESSPEDAGGITTIETDIEISSLSPEVRALMIRDGAGNIPSTPLAGDIDLDGDVDRGDAAQWVHTFGLQSNATWMDGDFNDDLAVTLADLALLQSNWSPASAAASVPEPATCLTCLILTAAYFGRRRVSRSYRGGSTS